MTHTYPRESKKPLTFPNYTMSGYAANYDRIRNQRTPVPARPAYTGQQQWPQRQPMPDPVSPTPPPHTHTHTPGRQIGNKHTRRL